MTVHVIAESPIMRRGIAAILADDGWDIVDDKRAAEGGCALVVWEMPTLGAAPDMSSMLEDFDGAAVLVVVGGATAADLGALVAQGARGAIDRDVEDAVLCQAARAIAEGRTVVNAGMRSEQGASRPPSLTRREAQVVELLAAGLTNHEIAEALVISENTVKNHIRRLFEKLQVRSRTEAVIRAARWGMVRIDSDGPGAPDPPPLGRARLPV